MKKLIAATAVVTAAGFIVGYLTGRSQSHVTPPAFQADGVVEGVWVEAGKDSIIAEGLTTTYYPTNFVLCFKEPASRIEDWSASGQLHFVPTCEEYRTLRLGLRADGVVVWQDVDP